MSLVHGSHQWAVQRMWSAATIEIHPYKDPCHCKSCMIGHFVSETGCIRHLPGSWPRLPGKIHKVTTTALSWKYQQRVYNQENISRYQQSVQPGKPTKIPTKCTTQKTHQDTNEVYNQENEPRYTNKVYVLLVSWSAFLVVNLAVNCTLSLQYSN